jgi:hypothetical protein
LNRGEIRWYTFQPPDKRRPVLILTRNEVMDHFWREQRVLYSIRSPELLVATFRNFG